MSALADSAELVMLSTDSAVTPTKQPPAPGVAARPHFNAGNKNGSRWPAVHDDELKALYGAQYSCSIIAEYLNEKFRTSYTRNAIIGRVHRLDLPLRGKKKPVNSRARKPRPVAWRARIASKKYPTPKQAFAIEPVTRLRVADVVPLNLDLIELGAGQCNWPYGDGRAQRYTFCGHPTHDEKCSYCPAHQALSIRGDVS